MRRLNPELLLFAGLALACSVPALAADNDRDAGAAAGGVPALARISDDGPILVTPAGMSLYSFTADDSTPGKPVCTNKPYLGMTDPNAGLGMLPVPGHQFQKSCTDVWHPYLADGSIQPRGDWSLVDRPEGGKQWAYQGHPLYTSVRDTSAGDRNGVAVGEYGTRFWHLATPAVGPLPPGLQLVRDGDTLVIATGNGRPVYTPGAGHGGKGAELFAPLEAPALATLDGDWSVAEASAGQRQYVFRGKPLYVAPASLSDVDIDHARGWDKVVFRKTAGTPAEIRTRFTTLGDIYTDKAGKTLYVFSCTSVGSPIGAPGCDAQGGAAAYWAAICGTPQECSRRWRPYRAPANAKSVGEWSVIDVADPLFSDPTGQTGGPELPHVKAWAYRGHALYTYYQDKDPGDIWGNQLRWHSFIIFNPVVVPGHALKD